MKVSSDLKIANVAEPYIGNIWAQEFLKKSILKTFIIFFLLTFFFLSIDTNAVGDGEILH